MCGLCSEEFKGSGYSCTDPQADAPRARARGASASHRFCSGCIAGLVNSRTQMSFDALTPEEVSAGELCIECPGSIADGPCAMGHSISFSTIHNALSKKLFLALLQRNKELASHAATQAHASKTNEILSMISQARDPAACAQQQLRMHDNAAMEEALRNDLRNPAFGPSRPRELEYGQAYTCPDCGVGPVMHVACHDLTAHDGQHTVRGGRVNNACPNPHCQFFAPTTSSWLPWNGRIVSAEDAERPGVVGERQWGRPPVRPPVRPSVSPPTRPPFRPPGFPAPPSTPLAPDAPAPRRRRERPDDDDYSPPPPPAWRRAQALPPTRPLQPPLPPLPPRPPPPALPASVRSRVTAVPGSVTQESLDASLERVRGDTLSRFLVTFEQNREHREEETLSEAGSNFRLSTSPQYNPFAQYEPTSPQYVGSDDEDGDHDAVPADDPLMDAPELNAQGVEVAAQVFSIVEFGDMAQVIRAVHDATNPPSEDEIGAIAARVIDRILS